jgi:uncharacterized protein YbbC (DUF1343 family)
MKKTFYLLVTLLVTSLLLSACQLSPQLLAENKNISIEKQLTAFSKHPLSEYQLSESPLSESSLRESPLNESQLNEPSLLKVGAEQSALYLPKLQGKRVGLVVNQTSVVNGQHLVDFLLSKKVNVSVIFAPEHGFRGDRDAGEKFSDTLDKKTGVPLVSIYGKSKKPSREVMASVDVIIFDIQDVGVRFYTYISSMHYMMAAANEANIEFMVLDRPNPNGMYIDGPVLEAQFQSFVGMHPIPLLHGLTVGELARMIVGEGWLTPQSSMEAKDRLELTVIPVANYHHGMPYSLAIKPSPNLPNDNSIALYPSLGFFEATPVSIGRGTQLPFQVIGHDSISLGNYAFMPISTPGAALKPKLMNKQLKGVSLALLNQTGLSLSYLLEWYQAFTGKEHRFFIHPKFMDKLAGTDKLRKAIEAGHSEQQIKQSWQQDLAKYRRLREQYLLYR